MTEWELAEDVRHEVAGEGPVEARAGRAAELIRSRTGRRWVGIYRITGDEVRNLAWSGPAAPAHPNFPADRGLSGAAIRSRTNVLSNDVAADPRYLTNQDTTGSELIVPVVLAETVVGTLNIEEARTNAFDENDEALFELLAAALTGLYD